MSNRHDVMDNFAPVSAKPRTEEVSVVEADPPKKQKQQSERRNKRKPKLPPEFIFDEQDTAEALKEYWVSPTDIPENMQINIADVNPGASVASYVCYSDSKSVPLEIIATRVGLSVEDVETLLDEAEEFKMYDKLVEEFLKGGE